MFFFVPSYCTGLTPPIGSTICTVSRAAAAFPFTVSRTVYGQRTLIFGVWFGAVSVTFRPLPPANRLSAATNNAASFTCPIQADCRPNGLSPRHDRCSNSQMRGRAGAVALVLGLFVAGLAAGVIHAGPPVLPTTTDATTETSSTAETTTTAS